MRTYLENATLIDGMGAPAQPGAGLVIEGDTLVEAHIHLSYNHVKVIADLDLNCPPEYSTLVSAKNAELALARGYTAARSAGSVLAVDVTVLQDRTRLSVMKGGRWITDHLAAPTP